MKVIKFTLIEILATMAILCVLFGLSVAGYQIAMQKAAEADTRSMIAQIKTAMTAYGARTGYFIQNRDSSIGMRLDVVDTAEYRKEGCTNSNCCDGCDGIDNDGDGFIDTNGKEVNGTPGLQAPPDSYPDTGIDLTDYLQIKAKHLNADREILDAWGSPIKYLCPGTKNRTSFDVYSAGPDADYATTEDNIYN